VPWDANTLVNVYSVGKPVIAAAVLVLAARGLVDLDAPVSAYWPEFQTPASVRQVLSHTSGLPAFPVPRPAAAWVDWDLLCADLAAATPQWQPGDLAAEHALTYGHLLGELVRRVAGRSPASFVAELGFDFGFALSGADLDRCAELEYDAPDWPTRTLGDPGTLRFQALAEPAGATDLTVVNGQLWRTAAVPAVNLHATATAIARFYAAVLDGGLPEMALPQYTGPDLFLERDVTWGLGVQLEPNGEWGQGGLGGNIGWAQPADGLAVAYVTRRLGDFAAVDRIDEALKTLMPG
jgi:CubicO group peptidase (beta-lactamase class C family)